MSHFLIYQGDVLLAKIPEEGDLDGLLLAFGTSREEVRIEKVRGLLKNALAPGKKSTYRPRKRHQL